MHLKKLLAVICLLFATCKYVQAQQVYTLADSSFFDIKKGYLLVDKQYSLQQILTDSTLPFTQAQALPSKGMQACWIKLQIYNPFAYDRAYAVWASPTFSNTLYIFDATSQKWQAAMAGHLHSNQKNIFTYATCVFKSKDTTTLYVKVSTEKFQQLTYQLSVKLSFEKLAITQANTNQKFIWWCVTVCIILAFFLYNLYLYFMFKDVVYIYYLLILLGGFWYITGYNFYCCFFTSFKWLVVTMYPNGSFIYLPFDRAVMQLSTALILSSFIWFTQSYLQTKTTMPLWNRVLKYILWLANLILIGITILEILGWLPMLEVTPLAFNVVAILVLLLLLLVACIGIRKKIIQAKYYLLAQALPLLLMLVLAVWASVTTQQAWAFKYLPNLAILAQTITFAIALVARVNKLKEDLFQKQILSEQAISQLAMEQEKNQRLQDKVQHDKKEIAAAQQIKLLMKELHHRVKNNLQIVSSLLSLQSYRIKDKAAADAVKEGQYRIEAMSLIHQRLYTTDNITEVNIKEYITDLSESLMQAYGFYKNEFDLKLQVANELMNVDKAIPLSLIINELVTNAFKYAFTKEVKPQLTVSLQKNEGMMALMIKDNGKGVDTAVWQGNTGTYGKELVHTFTKQLNGTIVMNNQNGTTFTIHFPL